jgi:hypothetical protein
LYLISGFLDIKASRFGDFEFSVLGFKVSRTKVLGSLINQGINVSKNQGFIGFKFSRNKVSRNKGFKVSECLIFLTTEFRNS